MTTIRARHRSGRVMIVVALAASVAVLVVLWLPPSTNCPAVYPRPWWCDADDVRTYALFATLVLFGLNAAVVVTALRSESVARVVAPFLFIVTLAAALVFLAGRVNS